MTLQSQDFKSCVYAIPPLAHISFDGDCPLTVLKKARTGIEPVNSGFADHCLTTWLPRQKFFKTLEALFIERWLKLRKIKGSTF